MKKAFLIKEDGEKVEVQPKNGKHFSLEELQGFVEGKIEILWPKEEDGMILVINEEGKLLELALNKEATRLWGYGDRTLAKFEALAQMAPTEMDEDDDFIVGKVLYCDFKLVP